MVGGWLFGCVGEDGDREGERATYLIRNDIPMPSDQIKRTMILHNSDILPIILINNLKRDMQIRINMRNGM